MFKMDSPMCVVVSLVFMMTIRVTVSLQCYKCSYTKLESDTFGIDTFLSAINSFSDEHCKLLKESDKTSVGIRECPSPKNPSNEMKCLGVTGEIKTTTKILGLTTVDVDIYTITRDCIEVSPSNKETTNGCHDDLPSNAQNVIKNFYTSTISLGDMTFNGQACYSDDNLTNSGLRIPGSMLIMYAGLFVTLLMIKLL